MPMAMPMMNNMAMPMGMNQMAMPMMNSPSMPNSQLSTPMSTPGGNLMGQFNNLNIINHQQNHLTMQMQQTMMQQHQQQNRQQHRQQFQRGQQAQNFMSPKFQQNAGRQNQ